MKNILKEVTLFTLIILFSFFTIHYSIDIRNIIISTSLVWLKILVPILFPTFILADFLLTTKIPYYIEKITHLNAIYFISIFTGSPTNAYILKSINTSKTKIAATTHYTSLLFTITTLNKLYKPSTTILFIICNIISNFIIIYLTKPPKFKYQISQSNPCTNLIYSIKKTTDTLLSILGTLIFFNILPIFIIKNIYLKTIITCLLEVTSGFQLLMSNSFPLFFTIICTCLLLSFNGLCILFQIKTIIPDINTTKLLKTRFLHFILLTSMIVTILFITQFISEFNVFF